MVCVASRDRLLRISKLEPVPITMARSGRPLLVIICARPVTIARMLTSTPTTPAIPMTMTDEAAGAQRHAPEVHAGDGGDLLQDVHATRPQRPARASTMVSRCTRHAGGKPLTSASTRAIATPNAITLGGSAPPPMPRACRHREDRCRDRKPQQRRHQAEQHRFHQDQRRHQSVREANGLQHGQFRYALAHGLHHRIAGQEQQREQHGADDRIHHGADVADLPELRLRVLRLVLGERLVGRVREQCIDGRAHLRGLRRIVDADDEAQIPGPCRTAALRRSRRS